MTHTLPKVLAAACAALLLAPAAFGQGAALDRMWADLASTDEGAAARATLGLARANDAVPFLKQRLQPVKTDAASIARLVKQLDSEEFDAREAAAKELEYLGKYARPLLEKHAADADVSAEAKRAIKTILGKIPPDMVVAAPPAPKIMGRSVSVRTMGNGEIQIIIDGKPLDLTAFAPPPPPAPNTAWIRAVRAVAVLEHVATPEARQLLEAMAAGEAEAVPTKAAKEALGRLKK